MKSLLTLILLFTFVELDTQDTNTVVNSGSGAKYFADRIEGSVSGKGPIREYYDNVKLFQKNVEINCNYAKLIINMNKSSLIGKVKLYQDELELITPRANYDGNLKFSETYDSVEINNLTTYLIADKAYYFSENNIADFYGNIKIENDSSILYSDRLKYNRINENSYAFGNVKVEGKYTHVMLYGDTVNNFPSENYSISKGNPLLVQIDTLQENETISFDTLQISSLQMEGYRELDNERYIFTDSVEIYKLNLKAKAKKAIYYKDKEFIELFDSPIIWFDSTQLYGDTVRIYFEGKNLKSIHSIGNAFSSSKNDTVLTKRIDQLLGDEIRIKFENKQITTVESYGNSKSLYFMSNKEGGDGVARNASDDIKIIFKNEKPDDIIWLGNNQGEYFPENILKEAIRTYYLPKFKWSEGKPKKINKKIINKRQ